MASSVRRDDGLGEGQQQLAGDGALHVAPVALEQRRAELLLQSRDLAAERRLGGMHGPRGPAEAASLGHGDE